MKKKFISLLLIFTLMIGMSTAFASTEPEPKASYYLDSYMVLLTPDGDGEMTVSFAVFANDRMDKIGINSITLEEEWTPDDWTRYTRVYGSSDPDVFYSTKSAQHVGEYTFTNLLPGVRYRATIVVYAGDSTGSDTGTITSTPKVCK